MCNSGRRQLNAIVTAKSMSLREVNSPVQDCGRCADQPVFGCHVLRQQIDGSIALADSDTVRCSLTRGNGGSYFHLSYFGHNNGVPVLDRGQTQNPGSTRFMQVPLGKGAGIQKIDCHPFGPRISITISLNGLPLVLSNAACTSSRPSVDLSARACIPGPSSADNPAA